MLTKFLVSLTVLATLIPAPAAKGELFVLATLYRRHEKTAVYDLPTLRKIIQAIKPDVMVLDVTPAELKEEKVHPSKIEYTEVIFPMIKDGKYRVYPSEPSEPLFSEIVNAVLASIKKFEAGDPQAATALKQFDVQTYDVLRAYWRSPADVNSALTDRVLFGKKSLERRLREDLESDERWTQHIAEVTLRAIKENPGKRVLLLAGIENCYRLRERLSHDSKIKPVDMERWLRDQKASF